MGLVRYVIIRRRQERAGVDFPIAVSGDRLPERHGKVVCGERRLGKTFSGWLITRDMTAMLHVRRNVSGKKTGFGVEFARKV